LIHLTDGITNWLIFEPKEKVAGGWIRLEEEELHNLHASSNTIRMIKSRLMRLVGHVTRMRDITNTYKLSSENLKRRDHSDDLGVDRIILEWNLGKENRKLWTGCMWLKTGISGGLL
jgi:hypothetical protein